MPYFLREFSEHSVLTFFFVLMGSIWLQITGCNAKPTIGTGNPTPLEEPGQWAIFVAILIFGVIWIYALCCTCEWCPHQKWMNERERQRFQAIQNQMEAETTASAMPTGSCTLGSTMSTSSSTNVHPYHCVNGKENYAGYDNSNGLGKQSPPPYNFSMYY